jgi:hypothetical protein
MPVMGVCGDSYMAPTLDGAEPMYKDSPGKHHSEIMSKFLGYDLLPLSKGGASNGGIRLQIETMIQEKVDFVLIGTTTHERVEFKISEEDFDHNLMIYNVDYSGCHNRAKENIKFGNNRLASENLTTVLNGHAFNQPEHEDRYNALKDWYMNLYDGEYKKLQDTWIIANAVQELEYHKIPYLIFVYTYMLERSSYLSQNNRRILGINHHNQKLIPWSYPFDIRGWHSSDESQIDIARNLCDYILTNDLLTWS